jgi:transposase
MTYELCDYLSAQKVMQSPSIHSSALQKRLLLKISRQTTSSVREVERSKIILLLLEGQSSLQATSETGRSWPTIQQWRYRWLSYESIFSEIEGRAKKEGMEHDLEQKIRESLADAPRPGGPSRITAEQYCQILGVSLEHPGLSGRPITQWTLDELVDEVQKRGIASISRSQLGDFLKRKRGEAAQNQRLAEP